jgi:diaminohydroxyphosphoribosylaminopyrimidine deaminase/5-amino-6-(5-phosphoribosylamino)uracil reductase
LNRKSQEHYMQRALDLAEKAKGRTSPNPMVGAVIVKSGKVVGEGYHKRAGLAHAEIVALRKAGARARGADLYVNLEPCCHDGRTPPCTEAIIAAGIQKVVVSMRDPNSLVGGKGIRSLKRNGIEVATGVLRKDSEQLNEAFVKYIRVRRPFVILKSALSLDGKTATRTGDSRWITGSEAREYVHRLRNNVDAVLVGAGTVRVDNPRLTVRLRKERGRNPVRVIVGGKSGVSLSANVFRNAGRERVIYAVGKDFSPMRENKLRRMGVEVLILKQKKGRVDLGQLMDKLGEMGIVSILIEGGSEINACVLEEKLVDKLIYFLAPKIIGGNGAPSVVGGCGVKQLKDALSIRDLTVFQLGNDLVIEGKF